MRYWDSSALVVLLVDQPHSVRLRELYEEDPEIVTWTLSEVEIRSALQRLGRESAVDERSLQLGMQQADALWRRVFAVTAIEAVKARAKRLLGVHPLRAADALQLGAAIASCYDDPSGASFVCLDDRLGSAAAREGFSLEPH